MDGARIANAAAYLDMPLRAFTSDVGVDILSFGGTKNGLLCGDAVVVLNPDAVRGVEYLRMSSAQLASKMRFISVQFEALLAGDLWLRNAKQANAMAQRLYSAIRGLSGLEILHPVEANMIFAVLSAEVTEALEQHSSLEHGRDTPVRFGG
jgi:threonine aldolase